MTDASPAATVLSDSYRRHVCRYLAAQDDLVVTLEELTWAVADEECATTGASVAGTDDRRIATTLHHVHLPKLDDAGVLEYDADRGTVTADAGLVAVRELLEVLDDRSGPLDLRT